jgi:thiol-disulfide isomerase/thioredoxin
VKTTLLIALFVAAVAVLAAQVLKKRKPEPPTQTAWTVPTQLDRNDFTSPTTPWLVVAFTSSTCDACATTVSKCEVLASDFVSVQTVDYQTNKALHERYGIDAVPTVVIADADGVVVREFVGPPNATDLWGAMAEVREPGSIPPPDQHGPGLGPQ